MENILRPWVSWSFLQNNYHQAVKKMESFCKKLHETQGRRIFSMD